MRVAADRWSGRNSEARLRAEPAKAVLESGEFVLRYGMVREILRRYLSPILVDSVLKKALAARNLTPAGLGHSSLVEMTSDIMIGLRLFVDEDRLPQLMIELAAVLEGDDS
jgi:hypothetical protein